MRTLLLLLFALAGAPIAVATAGDEAQAAIEAALAAEAQLDPRTALEHFRRADAARPGDAWIVQKIAKQLSDAAFLEPDREARRRLALEAMEHARRSVELDPCSAVNRLSLSVLYGRLAAYADISTRVEYARRIRHHAEEALALDPEYAWAHHVLGRWHVEMADLGATRRALASMFFGGLPRASLDEGVRRLERAVALEPSAVAHRVELGVALARTGRREAAREHLSRALDLPSRAIYDSAAKDRAREALTRLAPQKADS